MSTRSSQGPDSPSKRYRQPATNPNYVDHGIDPVTPSANQAFAGMSSPQQAYANAPVASSSASAPVWDAQPAPEPAKPKLEHVRCGTCKTINGVPPGAPSFNCYKCGRTSTKPGLAKQSPPKEYVNAPPQSPTQQQPVQVQQKPTTVVVQQNTTQVVTAPVAGNQLAYGAYGGGSGAAFAGGMLAGAMLTRPRYGYGYGRCYGPRFGPRYGCRRW